MKLGRAAAMRSMAKGVVTALIVHGRGRDATSITDPTAARILPSAGRNFDTRFMDAPSGYPSAVEYINGAPERM